MAESVKYLIEAGQKLIEKKKSLAHGEWLPWLKANADALGFSSERTARRLMAVAKRTLTSDITEAEASQISKSVWGNKPKAVTSKSKRKARFETAPQAISREDRTAALMDGGL